MSEADDNLSLFQGGYWQAQPRWVKALTLLIAIPAWLVLAVSSFTGAIGGTLQIIAFSVVAAVALLHLTFIFRAYWRMDL